MLKWLQYETVLGPEDGEGPGVPTTADAGAPRMIDEEKDIQGKGEKKVGTDGMMDVSGPGLGDYHTSEHHGGGVSPDFNYSMHETIADD